LCPKWRKKRPLYEGPAAASRRGWQRQRKLTRNDKFPRQRKDKLTRDKAGKQNKTGPLPTILKRRREKTKSAREKKPTAPNKQSA